MGDVSVEKLDSDTYRTRHDMTRDGLTLTITEALAEVHDESPVELINDFTEYVDPDALDQLFRVPPSRDPREESGRLHLTIHGSEVIIHADGEIHLKP